MLAVTERPSVKQIARSVAKSGALLREEKELAELRAGDQELRNELVSWIEKNGNGAHNSQIVQIDAQRAALGVKINEAFAKLAPLRAAYGVAVREALAPLRRDAAEKLLDLISEMRGSFNFLNESVIEIERTGADTIRMPPIGWNDIEAIAHRIVRTGL